MDAYDILKSKGISVGDKIKVDSIEGILMPKTEFVESDVIVIKMNNGYNIGIKLREETKVELIEKKEERLLEKPNTKKFDSNKPTVSILACGGTIASRVEYRTGAVFPSFSPEELIEAIPEIGEMANIKARKLFDLFSEDMQPEHWKIIAQEVSKEIESGVDGVVCMHGTDTMHYTSAALSFMLQDLPVPVVLVGAQRSSDRGSSDNIVNLVSAVLFAAKGEIAEVVVCMHESMNDDYCAIHRGTKVRKMHTSRRDAFKSINTSPLARVNYLERKIEYLTTSFRKRDKSRKLKLDININPNVGIFYFHPGAKPELLKEMSKFYDGIVIASTGLGHVGVNPGNDKLARSFLPTIKELIEKGIPIVFASQTIYGRLNMNVYSTGRILEKAGVIGNLCDWTIETALVKLMFVLGHTKDMNEIKKMMLTNIAGEISERSEP
ncbi:MAG: Glu-tRNA(Gln) amidotransferase subunit GatD [Candidatus Aenigmatarchaeota archaeon]|jgi:glutamyl-tRNA(Gln) amidotransferase subunit D